MRYHAKQLQLMAQVVTDAEKNSTHKWQMFMNIMAMRTGMTRVAVKREIELYL